ncbi:hypothetical protein ASD32_20500 [Rhizobium sp. Root483D2]|nr:hypothetical protein ASD32_20500 [Rhizobium sp. Root483D2]
MQDGFHFLLLKVIRADQATRAGCAVRRKHSHAAKNARRRKNTAAQQGTFSSGRAFESVRIMCLAQIRAAAATLSGLGS